jgi:(p)ppGpp synthase/HD superfamily hydrolase
MINQDNFFNAYYFAMKAHGDQKRIGGEKYINHPFRVAKRTEKLFPQDEPLVLAAMLHDVLEDTDVDGDWMSDMFGLVVTKYVKYLTNTPKVEGINRQQRFINDMTFIKFAPEGLESVKLIDRLDNLSDVSVLKRSFLKVYYQESHLMLDMLDRANSDLREELFETLNYVNEIYKFN